MYLLTESALEDFHGIPTDDPNAVVVGLAPDQFNFYRWGTVWGCDCGLVGAGWGASPGVWAEAEMLRAVLVRGL